MEAKEFSIATILTILTGTAFEQGLDNAKLLIEHMTGDPATELTFLMSKGRLDICQNELVAQYPDLKWIWLDNAVGVNKDNYLSRLRKAEKKIGADKLLIKPIENMPTPEEYFGLV